ncbi:uncharacterized protein CC84DRAFT_1239328 [Paraphaeosphaeria sporulosa]|uniref:Uncharacterized protein n=1 Tax=Paraphaeosphaeria sporulosa TaxID=1460663 RepID=A0A177CMT7_9PLEO|nr:uncharacterized protein CC84DRAFT_1239328 [Paraphaeosphaeria sporulosa]OAG08200.1 hypothetical protein CC84DRAFT_1239328 [Paraphaeosphaeria sporulosa]
MEDIDEVVRLYAREVLATLDIDSEPGAYHSNFDPSTMEYEGIAILSLLSSFLSAEARINVAPSYHGHDALVQSVRSMRASSGDGSSGIMALHDSDNSDSSSYRSVNYGWALLEERDADGRPSATEYRKAFMYLGLLFWDDDGFLQTRLTTINDFQSLLGTLNEGWDEAGVSVYNNACHDTAIFVDFYCRCRLRPDDTVD